VMVYKPIRKRNATITLFTVEVLLMGYDSQNYHPCEILIYSKFNDNFYSA
jgi:hypothetical protein